MTAQEIRQKYFDFMVKNGHKLIPRAQLVPQNDPTTLFTGSGMQPLVQYLLGEEHPEGAKLVDSQTCFRAEDMDEVGDNRHTTFFEMLGNWSLGEYYKKEQLEWFYKFLTDEVGLDASKLYITCFIGDEQNNVPKDTQSAEIWKSLLGDVYVVDVGSEQNGYQNNFLTELKNKIFYYDASKNWWSRNGIPANMPQGEPGGPDSEVFYDFGTEHDKSYGEFCHPNCDCGRFLEIGNSVFMAYKKTADGFEPLPKPNVDFGGGLERIAAAKLDNPDVFKISLLWPIIQGLEQLSDKMYDEHQESMRVIADHLRAATWLAVDGALPSNKEQGYVVRRLLRRAIRFAFDLGIEKDLCIKVVPIVAELYKDFDEFNNSKDSIAQAFDKEEKTFRQTLRKGLRKFDKEFELLSDSLTSSDKPADAGSQKLNHGQVLFELYDTYGFPVELSVEEAKNKNIKLDENWQSDYQKLLEQQRERSRTAGAGVFKGGLADHSEQVIKYHTATHLMYQALKNVLGEHVVQRGSNITAERIRFDFSHPEKVTREQLDEVEKIVNEKIKEDLPVTWEEVDTETALKTASGAFGDKYGDKVKVYTIGDKNDPFSREICGGPHVEHTGQIGLPTKTSTESLAGEGDKTFKITKEEASSAGVRRIKAVLQ
jgi:alanyl-tRNA synthetase